MLLWANRSNYGEKTMLSQKFAGRSLATIGGTFAMIMAATGVEAAILPAPVGDFSTSVVQLVGDACGPGRQAGANGVCHPDSWFTRRYYCPPGMHLGPYGRRCLPN
jgi:hypothetical protein